MGDVDVTEAEFEAVLELVAERRWPDVREAVRDWTVADLSDLLTEFEGPDYVLLFRSLPRAMSAEVFAHLDAHDQETLLAGLTDQEMKRILEEISPDDRTAVLEELPAEVTRRLLKLLSPEDLVEARTLLGYPEESVGRLMTPDYVAVRPEWTLREAVEHIRTSGRDSETISRIYVTDERGHLLDDLRLRQFILGDAERKVTEVMDGDYVSLSAFDDREEAVKELGRQDVMALPVTDSDGILLGIVTHDDLYDVAEEETTEDIQLAASVQPLKTTYRHAGVGLLYQRRVLWLGGLVVLSLLSSLVLRAFEATLEQVVALVFFIPLLMASGGNTGSQSSTLMVRALATEDVHEDEFVRVFGKEVAVGLMLAATLGVLAAGVGLLVHAGADIGLVVGITMFLLVLAANLLGMGMPFLLDRFGADPAVASAPLITVLVDALGLLIYLLVARAVLGLG